MIRYPYFGRKHIWTRSLRVRSIHLFQSCGLARPHINAALLTAIICLIGVSCGKVGAPVPPARLSERTAELTAIQRGASVLLSWPSPVLVPDESSRSYVSRVDIYRLVERRDQEPILDPDDYEQTAQVIGVLDRTTIEAQLKSFGVLHFTDAVNLTSANIRLRYAVRYVNKRGQTAAFSNTVALEPLSVVALPPSGLVAKAEVQGIIDLSWSPPSANVNGNAPATLVGYNIYRRAANHDFGGELLNAGPVTDTSFSDTRFQYLVDYVYFVRALSSGSGGLVESADSEPLSFRAVDSFAPAAPHPVSVASANGTISLFWPSSPEPDVVGYNVYRADAADTPDKDWVIMNDQPLTKVTFRDDLVVIDQTYFYRVTAVDRFNNESVRSRIVSETGHP